MESEQPVEKTEPVEEKAVSAGTREDNRRGRERRPRFRRDDRGRGDRGERGERARGQEEGGRQSGSVREAIRHVENIRNDLRRVLDEMHEVIRILEQAEREKTASEAEIEQLKESLRHLQHDRGQGRYSRSPEPRRAPVQEAPPVEEEETDREVD